MSKIVRFPRPAEDSRKQEETGDPTLAAAKLMTYCSFHHLKASFLNFALHPNFETASDAIPVIDWATRELNALTASSEQNFKSLKMLADIINQLGTYVEHRCGYGVEKRDAEELSSI